MGVLTRFLRSSFSPGVPPPAWWTTAFPSSASSTGITVNELTAQRSAAVFACIRIISETIASLPLQVFKDLPNGDKDRVTDHWSVPLLHRAANPEMTAMEFWEINFGHLASWGNSFSEIQFDNNGKVVALWPLRPDRMTVYRDRTTSQLVYQYSVPYGGALKLSADQVLHLRLRSLDGILGMSPIAQAMEAIGLDLALDKFGGKVFANGSRPGGALTAPGRLSDAARTNMRDSWEAAHRGLDNAHRVAILEDGTTFTAIGLAPEEAQFIATRQFTLQQIARIWRVPPHMLQELSRATFSNIEHQGIEFVTQTLRPYLVNAEQRLQLQIFGLQSPLFAKWNVEGLLRGDINSRYTAYATARQWGWLSVDEIREREDLNRLPDGKGMEFLKPVNMTEAGTPTPPDPGDKTPDDSNDMQDTGDMKDMSQMRALVPVLHDVAGRIARRERQDVLAQARKLLGKGDREAFATWCQRFAADHADYTAEQLTPVAATLAALGGARVDPQAIARRHVGEELTRLGDCIQGSADDSTLLTALEEHFAEAAERLPAALTGSILNQEV